ncbi:MAG: NADP-dependent oxidoreductase [Alphaproteobacteria bacterium]|nr:NADP-dependent oxidoreductase [Alphaproteobacteria bacterium]
MQSREMQLVRRPSGLPREDDFRLVERKLGPCPPGLVRVRNRFISVDPYMRGRMTSPANPFALNEAVPGRTIGEVVESGDRRLRPGDLVRSMSGWREAFDAPAAALEYLDPRSLPPQAYLGVAGVSGLSAYAGLVRVAQLKQGETLFVSAASGAVGMVACQVARILGARVVGSAGGPEKCAFLREIGVDAVIDYKAEPDLDAALARAAPAGIDVYFDNVGGAHLEAAIAALRPFGRVAICGMISIYNEAALPPGPANLVTIVGKSARIEGFLAATHMDLMPEFIRNMEAWIGSGAVRYRDTIHDGIEALPRAFISLFTGANFGKPLVRIP